MAGQRCVRAGFSAVEKILPPPATTLPTEAERLRFAGEVEKVFRSVDGVVDVDSTLNATSPKISLVLDREQAAAVGTSPGVGLRLGALPDGLAEAGQLRLAFGDQLVLVLCVWRVGHCG